MADDANETRELWLFLLGGAYALLRREDGTHVFTREELLGMVDIGHAPADIGEMYEALENHDSKAVRKWLAERGVQWGEAKSIFQCMADRVRHTYMQEFLAKKLAELGYAARLKSKPLELAAFLEEMSAAIRGMMEK